jgi:hypothetical protein
MLSISMHRRHAAMLSRAALSADDLQGAGATLHQLERFWLRGSDLVQRQQLAARFVLSPDRVIDLDPEVEI